MKLPIDPAFLTCRKPQITDLFTTRRDFLNKVGMGMGALSLAQLLGPGEAAAAASSPTASRQAHFPAKAKRVIHIFLSGAPSHIDTWDPKPALNKLDGGELPEGRGIAFGSPLKFNRMGRSGIEVSEAFPELGKLVDEMTVVRSMHTDVPDHEIATVFMNTGSLRFARPSFGSWVTYGLGTVNQNLPAFVSLRPGGNRNTSSSQSAFLPGVYQGTSVNTTFTRIEQLIENIKSQFATPQEQRAQLDLLHKINEVHSQNLQKDAQLEARIEAFELAYKMQVEATDAFDISKESQAVKELYGDTAQGRQMLIARRLIEKGVRFVQAWHGGWDTHNAVSTAVPNAARGIDKPVAALLTDLKQRGMLEDTLVVIGGEFGRTASRDGEGGMNGYGRSHSHRGFSTVLAGGGVKKGYVHGATDELGVNAVQDKMHVHDFHATMLHLLGFDHKKLTYRYNGRDFRLTDVHGEVAKGVLA